MQHKTRFEGSQSYVATADLKLAVNAALTLQSSSNLGPTAVWASNSPGPVVVNGQNTVTNPITGTQMFFRLSQ